MKRTKIIIIFVFFLSSFLLAAQQQFDIYSFNIPQGYSAQINGESMVITSPDEKISLLLIPVRQCNDIAYVEFGKDWSQFVSSKYTVLGFPNRVTTRFPDGWEMTTGQAKVVNGEVTMWIQLRNFTKSDKKATIIIFAIDENQQESVRNFMSGLSLSDTPKTISPRAAVDNRKEASPVPEPQAQITNNKVEVWMRIKSGAWNMSAGYYTGNYYDLSANRMAYTVLFPDGSYTGNEIPRTGLSGFSKNVPEAAGYTWGAYTRQGGILHIKSDYEDLNLVYRSDAVLENPSSSFLYYRCKPVDGLKLNGSWSYIPNSVNDPYYDEPGCRQVIFFRDDMTFSDRGAFVSDCRYPGRDPQEAPGNGTYSISNFTLFLRYDDGRIIRKSFTGALMNDPLKDNRIIYIGGINFFKRETATGSQLNTEKPQLTGQSVQANKEPALYGNLIYRIPQGWTSKESPGFMEIFPERLAEQEVFSIILLKGKSSSLSLQDELAATWDEFAGMLGASKLMEVNGKNYNENEISRTLAGWEYISGHGSIRTSSDFFVHAYIIRVNDRNERVIVLAKEIRLDGVRNNIDPTVHHYPYYVTITDFIYNLGFGNFRNRTLPEPPSQVAGISGVWAGMGFIGGELKSTYIIFFPNGQVYYGSRFPVMGLYGLDTYAERERVPRYWGTYDFKSTEGTVKMPYGVFPVRLEGNNLIVKPISEEHRFIKVPATDNIRLNGTWTIDGENNIPATITFGQDGSFTDKGALKVLDHSLYLYYSIADGGGSGKYLVKDHTIIFSYNDGRKLQIAFPGLNLDRNDSSPEKLVLSFNEDILIKQ